MFYNISKMFSLHLKSNNDNFPSKLSSLFNLFNSYNVVLIFFYFLKTYSINFNQHNVLFHFIANEEKKRMELILHLNVTSFSLSERFFILQTKISWTNQKQTHIKWKNWEKNRSGEFNQFTKQKSILSLRFFKNQKQIYCLHLIVHKKIYITTKKNYIFTFYSIMKFRPKSIRFLCMLLPELSNSIVINGKIGCLKC